MVSWSAENDARLLLTILSVHSIKIDYAACADRFGQGVTAKALLERIAKLKKNAAELGDAGPSAPATPRKRKNQRVVEGGVVKRRVAKKLVAEEGA